MVFNRFSLNLFIRVALILTNLIGISIIYQREDLIYTTIFLVIIAIVQVYFLLSFINITNRELTKFVLAIQDSDTTAKFPELSGSFHELFRSFEKILEILKNQQTQKEAQLQFVQYIVNEIDIGIVSMDQENKIVLTNRSANHIRDKYTFESGSPFIDVLINTEESSIHKSTSYEWGAKEFMINKTQLKLLDENYSIYTLKDIKSQLEKREIESWQKLIRILAHEIMNSVTPIASLSETTLSIISNNKNNDQLVGKPLENVAYSVETIKSRSEGLLEFLDDYRKLIKLPKPKPVAIDLESFMEESLKLFEGELKKNDINTELNIDAKSVFADQIQLEQIMTNLITNAIQAMEKTTNKELRINSTQTLYNTVISVIDNGPGIDPNKLEKIFVPFYTTKSSGSGIGLSLSRQIVNLHQGTMEVESSPGRTSFTIQLPLEH